MLSNRCVICLSIAIVLIGLVYNHCSLQCLLNALGYIPFIGNAVVNFKAADTVTPTNAPHDKATSQSATPPPNDAVTNADPLPQANSHHDGLFTKEQLALYNGDKGLYLSILGSVYNVEKGKKYYSKGQAYHGFTGRDASRSFVTGNFSEEGLRDDVLDLKTMELLELEKWKKTYEKEYIAVGKLIGRYYDQNGEPTQYLKDVLKAIQDAHKADKVKENRKSEMPPCNLEWINDVGGKVWCTKNSGGIERDWVGIPRQLFEVETGKTRCACVKPQMLNDPNLKEYPNCAKDADTCKLS